MNDKNSPMAVDTKTASKMVGLPVGTLVALRRQFPYNGPPYFKVGERTVRYKVAGPQSLESWMDERIVQAGEGAV